VAPGWKLVHAVLTDAGFVPSLLTAFNLFASLNIAGKARGGKGLLRWILKLPWGDPSVAAQLFAALLFLFGGTGGLINASYNVNLVIHNTAWVPGHCHLTEGTAVTLSFIGISYWLIPHLTGRKLWSRRVALAQAWTWFLGMAIFSRGMHLTGTLGAPRRTMLGAAPYVQPEWQAPLACVGIGGVILFLSGVFLFVNVLMMVFAGRRLPVEETPDMPVAEAVSGPEAGPSWLSEWKPWLAVTSALILVAYGPVLFEAIRTAEFTSAGFTLW
jgi:cytochrome c oxidase subunit 1